MRQVLVELAARFEPESGHRLLVTFDGGAMIVRRVERGEAGVLKQTLLMARTIARPDPAQGGSSGLHIQQALELEGTHAVTPLVQARFNERNREVSPDGRWLAYEANDSGRFEIYVRPFPSVTAGLWPVSMGGGTRPL